MTRRRLANRRPCERIAFEHNGAEWTALVGLRLAGLSDEGSCVAELGDVFITAGKVGSELEATAQTGALLISLAMQHGIDIRVFQRSIPRHPSGRAADVIGAAIDAVVAAYCGGTA